MIPPIYSIHSQGQLVSAYLEGMDTRKDLHKPLNRLGPGAVQTSDVYEAIRIASMIPYIYIDWVYPNPTNSE